MNNFDGIKKAIMQAAEEVGVEKYDIYYESSSQFSADTLKNEISSISSGVSGGLCFRCLVDGKFGYASTEFIDVSEMRPLVLRAVNNAKYIESDDEGIIFSGSEKYYNKTIEYKSLPELSVIKNNALELQKENYACGKNVSDGTSSSQIAFECEMHIVNSEGLDLSNKASVTGAYVGIVVREGDEAAEDMAMSCGDDLEQLKSLCKKAYNGAMGKIGAGEVSSGKYDIIIDGNQMRSILSAFWTIFSARSVRLGLSLLADKLGTKIAADCVTITDNPFDEHCPLQTTFDAEGVATYKKNIINNGELKTFLYNLSEAKRAGTCSTGNGYKGSYADTVGIRPYCFAIEPGKYSDDELFSIVNNGIYITEMKGLHAGANAVTGDFSIESAGYMIKDGKKDVPVKSFTIAGNFYELLKNITHVASETKYGFPGGLNTFASPAVVVKNISVAGK